MKYNLDHNDYAVLNELEEAFVVNPDQRTPCVLLLDTSGSMTGAPIKQLNEGLRTFKHALMQDSLARRRVEVAVVTFGGRVEPLQDFITADQFTPPVLSTSGDTPMGEALERALDMVATRKAAYAQAGVPHTAPWIFLITDGAPTDAWERAAARVQQVSASKQAAVFMVGVAGADMGTLARIAWQSRPPLKLEGLNFQELFIWLSASLKSVSHSTPGVQAALPPPKDWAEGWGAV